MELLNTGDAFVDDAYLGATSTCKPSEQDNFMESQQLHKKSAISNLQTLSPKWERLLSPQGEPSTYKRAL